MKADIKQEVVEFKISGDSPEFGRFEKSEERLISKASAKDFIARGLAVYPKTKKKPTEEK